MALIQKRSLILLTLLVTLFHVLLLSIHFDSYREWFYKKYAQISKPIRINWAPNLQSPTSVAQNSEVLSKPTPSASGSSANLPNSSPVKRSSFFISENPNSNEAETNFRNAQKLQQTLLNNEFQARSANTQNALRDLKEIFFKNSQSNDRKRCCSVTLERTQASCNSQDLTMFYQNIFDSLQSRLNDVAREGIKEFCD